MVLLFLKICVRIRKNFFYGGNILWNTSRLSKQETFATALRTADAASARPPASLHARPAAELQISTARARKANNCENKNAVVCDGVFNDLEGENQ